LDGPTLTSAVIPTRAAAKNTPKILLAISALLVRMGEAYVNAMEEINDGSRPRQVSLPAAWPFLLHCTNFDAIGGRGKSLTNRTLF
jgi:hypothetical protein